MSEAATAVPVNATPPGKLFTELKVSAHLMTFETGVYCIVHTAAPRRADDVQGLPGVRISLAPGPLARPDSVSICGFRGDGWLSGDCDATLLRVINGPAQVLVTIYQAPVGLDTAPRLQVLRLSQDPSAAPAAQVPAPAAGAAAPAPVAGMTAAGAVVDRSKVPDVVAHIQVRGDVGAKFGEWIGEKGSKRWIEGFMLTPKEPIALEDVEYQAVLGRGWLSPWVSGGQICGSRGMALPILGLRMRLKGRAAEQFDCSYSATFVDGAAVGPVLPGEPCEAETLAPMEAIQLVLTPKAAAGAAAAKPKPARAAETVAKKPAAAVPPAPPPAPPPAATRSIRGKPAPAKRPR
jgi:hypothetical protein